MLAHATVFPEGEEDSGKSEKEVSEAEETGEAEESEVVKVKDVPASSPGTLKKNNAGAGAGAGARLQAKWRDLLAAQQGFVPSLTAKQKAQLKYLLEQVPEGVTAEQVLDTVMRSVGAWSGFCEAAKAQKGAFGMPTLPELGFLQKFWDVAVNFHLAALAAPAKKGIQLVVYGEAVSAPVQLTAQPVVPAKVAEPKPTKEEMLAALGWKEAK